MNWTHCFSNHKALIKTQLLCLVLLSLTADCHTSPFPQMIRTLHSESWHLYVGLKTFYLRSQEDISSFHHFVLHRSSDLTLWKEYKLKCFCGHVALLVDSWSPHQNQLTCLAMKKNVSPALPPEHLKAPPCTGVICTLLADQHKVAFRS